MWNFELFSASPAMWNYWVLNWWVENSSELPRSVLLVNSKFNNSTSQAKPRTIQNSTFNTQHSLAAPTKKRTSLLCIAKRTSFACKQGLFAMQRSLVFSALCTPCVFQLFSFVLPRRSAAAPLVSQFKSQQFHIAGEAREQFNIQHSSFNTPLRLRRSQTPCKNKKIGIFFEIS